jgi:hypothetical protein
MNLRSVRFVAITVLKDLVTSFLGSFQNRIKSKRLNGFVIGFVPVRFMD